MPLTVKSATVSPEIARTQSFAAPDVGSREILGAATAVTNAAVDFTKQAQQASAESALANSDAAVRELLFNPQTGYYNTQGETAYKNVQLTKDHIAKIQESYGQNLSGGAAKAYQRANAKKNLDHFSRVDSHAVKGLKVWQETATTALVDNQTTWAYYNHNLLTEQTGHENFLAGRGQVVELLEEQGIDDPEIVKRRLREYDSKFFSNAVMGALNEGYSPAKEVFDRHKDAITDVETRERVVRALQLAKKREEEINIGASATALAHSLVKRFQSRGEILDYITGMQDKELASRVTPEVLRLFGEYKNSREENEQRSLEVADGFFREVPGATLEMFVANYPDEWDALTEQQKQDVRTRKVTSTDWTEYNRYLGLGDGLIDVDTAELTRTLAIPERKKIMDLRRKLMEEKGLLPGSGREREGFVVEPGISVSNARYTQQRVEMVMGPASKWNKSKKEQASALHLLIQQETQEAAMAKPNGRLSSQEYMNIVDDVTARHKLGEARFFGLASPPERNIGQIPPEEIKANTEWLRQNDLPVNSRTIIGVSQRGGKQADRLNDPNSPLYRNLAKVLRDRGLAVSPRNMQLLYLTLETLPE